jgi:hypothetical protein
MGHLLTKQPNGLYAVFGTIGEEFLIWDATKDEIIAWHVRRAAEKAREEATLWVTGKAPCRSVYSLKHILRWEALNVPVAEKRKLFAKLSKRYDPDPEEEVVDLDPGEKYDDEEEEI